jgi:hypothetical protein
MKHYLICVTIDIDPDGLSGQLVNRSSSSFSGFEKLDTFSDFLNDELEREAPLTWFIRIDSQIGEFFGDRLYLIKKYKRFFERAIEKKHELAWHPHLYVKKDRAYELPGTDEEACDLLNANFTQIKKAGLEFSSFRNGEGWHTNATMQLVRELGFSVDSTALPGISKSPPHLLNWAGLDGTPYFPLAEDYKKEGGEQDLLEIPMNTWLVKAPYDIEPKVRYMNPAVHEDIFKHALEQNTRLLEGGKKDLKVITFITHPDELTERPEKDALYSFNKVSFANNIKSFLDFITRNGATFEFCTLQNAGLIWKKS